jgi:hypothetical protein
MKFPDEAVRAQVEKIIASPAFANAGVTGPLLRAVVQKALAGAPMSGRTAEEIRELQSRLQQYYAAAGEDEPVVIELSENECRLSVRSQVEERPPGYQPSPGRKLFMFGLCLVALIAIWVFYWFAGK